MNRDFALPATPARARLMRRLSKVTAMHFDPALNDLAERGLADIAPSFSLSERDAIQHILDTGMRCVLPGPSIRSAEMVAEAVRIDRIEKVIVLGQNHQWWSRHFNPPADIEFRKISDHRDTVDSDFIRENRRHLLVIESYACGITEQMLFAHSFPKAISLSTDTGVSRLAPNVGVLFRGAPVELLSLNGLQRREMEVKGFKKTSPSELAFLLNIVADHLLESEANYSESDDVF